MGISQSIKKGLKNILESSAVKTVVDSDLGQGIKDSKLGKYAKKTFDDVVPGGKKDNMFFRYREEAYKPVEFLPGTNYTLKKRWGIGLPLAGLALSTGWETEKATERAKLGDIQSDELANTVSISRSDNLEKFVNTYNSPEQVEQLRKDTEVLQLKTGNATGDLVFALHNLRNNQDV